MYSKACVNGRSKLDKTKILMTNGSLMKVGQKYGRMLPLEHSAILLACIKRQLVLKSKFCFLEWPFYTGFTVYVCKQTKIYDLNF